MLERANPPRPPSANKRATADKSLEDWQIAALADAQHAVVAVRQLHALGYTRDAIAHRAKTGRLHRRYRGVYSVGHRLLTARGHWMAAVLAYGPNAVLSHRSAAALLELLQATSTKADITLPTSRRSRHPVTVHSAVLTPEEITVCDTIPVTTVARTLFDLAAVLSADQLLRSVEQAERSGVLNLRALAALAERQPHRHGVPALRAILDAYAGAAPTRSVLERDFLALIESAGLPRPEVNATLAGYIVDFYWSRHRLVVELDSRGFHSSPWAFETDRVRDAKLQRLGVRVLRVTHRRLHAHPRAVLDDVLGLIALAA